MEHPRTPLQLEEFLKGATVQEKLTYIKDFVWRARAILGTEGKALTAVIDNLLTTLTPSDTSTNAIDATTILNNKGDDHGKGQHKRNK